MKRLIVVLCVVGFIVALPMSHLAFAKKADKVLICHATDLFDVPQNQWTLVVGHVIEVSENALDAHLAHGDTTVINDIDDVSIFGLTWRQVAENVGLSTAGANCAGFILDLE
jgi:hypothetical protein